MAYLASAATGNFTASGTWKLIDSTSISASTIGSSLLTTSYVESTSFTPGAITIDGIGVWLASRSASPSGTISVRLAQGGTTVSGTEVTLNVSDLPSCSTTTSEGGWILFTFASPVTLAAATAYTVSAKTSVSSQVSLYRTATAGDWSRILRTTATQTPAAGDTMWIMGEHTGAGTGNNFTVTMDSTAATDYGNGLDGGIAIFLCKRATLTYGTNASTNYYLKLSANLIVYNGGTLNIGTTGTPIPRTSTAVLEFDPTIDGGMGLIVKNGGTFVAQGLSRTSGKNVVACKLNTDKAAGQTVLGVDTDTGWLSGDEIGIASTTQTATQCERRTLSADAGASSLTVSAGLTYAHSGTSPTQAEVILLTRNVKIRSAASTIMSYCYFDSTAIVDIDWVEFYYLGENATTKRGLEIATTTGSFNMQYSSLHDVEDGGVIISGANINNIVFSNNVTYYLNFVASSAVQVFLVSSTPAGASIVIDQNVFMYSRYSYSSYRRGVFTISDVGITFSNNTIAGIDGGTLCIALVIGENNASITGNFSGNTVHSCSDVGVGLYYGVQTSPVGFSGVMSNFTVWRCVSYGLMFSAQRYSAAAYVTQIIDLVLDTLTMFGNGTANIYISDVQSATALDLFIMGIGSLTINNLISNGDSSFPTTNGILLGCNIGELILNNCDFSTVAGIKTAHTNDINIFAKKFIRIIANNSKFGGTNKIAGQTNLSDKSFIKSAKYNQIAGNHKSWFKYGTIQTNSSTFKSAAPSEELIPNNASNKLESGSKKAAVTSGQTATFNVWVQKSASYNGNQPRLVLKRNYAAGITADTVLDTMTVGTGIWEQLTGTTAAVTDDAVLEVVVDVDGTAGSVYVDDWSVS